MRSALTQKVSVRQAAYVNMPCGFRERNKRLTAVFRIKLTGASRNTLKQHLRGLIERKRLEQHGSGRGVWYGLK